MEFGALVIGHLFTDGGLVAEQNFLLVVNVSTQNKDKKARTCKITNKKKTFTHGGLVSE